MTEYQDQLEDQRRSLADGVWPRALELRKFLELRYANGQTAQQAGAALWITVAEQEWLLLTVAHIGRGVILSLHEEVALERIVNKCNLKAGAQSSKKRNSAERQRRRYKNSRESRGLPYISRTNRAKGKEWAENHGLVWSARQVGRPRKVLKTKSDLKQILREAELERLTQSFTKLTLTESK